MSNGKPTLGANGANGHVVFRVWAPEAKEIQVAAGKNAAIAMQKSIDGYFVAAVPHVQAGDTYSYYVDGRGPFPDPASRYQPKGVHGASAIVNPDSYRWQDQAWKGIALEEAVFYELHVGTFTPEGTFRAAASKLNYLSDLGINAVELMPLADFAGERNWGYDGVAPFAPARCYGPPDDLRFFIDQAHQRGIAVLIDAVYNHFGPDGAYQGVYSAHYFTKRHHTPWGDAINFDSHFNHAVRAYAIENALRWVYEFHADGLRLDATHEIKDDSELHILAELNEAVRRAASELGRPIHIVAEDARNCAHLVKPAAEGGLGLSAVWADDFHHQMRRLLAGDREGYYAHFEGTAAALATLIKRGWQRGTSSLAGVPYSRLVYCIQNHDQIGNRAFGDRLSQTIDEATYRAASALLLLLPQTPLLFMGQEWAARTPFLYFTDHHDELGAAVTQGRRREFEGFSSFAQDEIPDPQSAETFQRSKLNWGERFAEPCASVHRLYKSLLSLRKRLSSAALVSPELEMEALDEGTLLLRRPEFDAVIRLRGHGEVHVPFSAPNVLWTSEDAAFAIDSQPILWHGRQVAFVRPGAIVFEKGK